MGRAALLELGAPRGPRLGSAQGIDTADCFVLERWLHIRRGGRVLYTLRSRERMELGTVELVQPDPETRAPQPWFVVLPVDGPEIHIGRPTGLLSNEIVVRAADGEAMASVEWSPFRRGYHYRVRSAAGRVLCLDGRGGGDFEIDIAEHGHTVGSLMCDLMRDTGAPFRPRRRGLKAQHWGNEGQQFLVRRTIEAQAGRLTPALRFGLLGAALWVDRKPGIFSRLRRT